MLFTYVCGCMYACVRPCVRSYVRVYVRACMLAFPFYYSVVCLYGKILPYGVCGCKANYASPAKNITGLRVMRTIYIDVNAM